VVAGKIKPVQKESCRKLNGERGILSQRKDTRSEKKFSNIPNRVPFVK